MHRAKTTLIPSKPPNGYKFTQLVTPDLHAHALRQNNLPLQPWAQVYFVLIWASFQVALWLTADNAFEKAHKLWHTGRQHAPACSYRTNPCAQSVSLCYIRGLILSEFDYSSHSHPSEPAEVCGLNNNAFVWRDTLSVSIMCRLVLVFMACFMFWCWCVVAGKRSWWWKRWSCCGRWLVWQLQYKSWWVFQRSFWSSLKTNAEYHKHCIQSSPTSRKKRKKITWCMRDVLYINVRFRANSLHLHYNEFNTMFAFASRWITAIKHWQTFPPPTM